MANWITHVRISDNILEQGFNLDRRGLCIGSIAPDCNIESEDWKTFIPPREVTHWMHGENKLTVDYEGFFNQYIRGKEFISQEHYAFLIGYYCHLVTDVAYQKFIRDEKRVRASFERIKENSDLQRKVQGYPKNFDTLKMVFGRSNVFNDIRVQEAYYVTCNEQTLYNTILRKTEAFNDYLDYLPSGAIARKIKVMAYEASKITDISNIEFYFFSREEYESFIMKTTDSVCELLREIPHLML